MDVVVDPCVVEVGVNIGALIALGAKETVFDFIFFMMMMLMMRKILVEVGAQNQTVVVVLIVALGVVFLVVIREVNDVACGDGVDGVAIRRVDVEECRHVVLENARDMLVLEVSVLAAFAAAVLVVVVSLVHCYFLERYNIEKDGEKKV